MKARILLLISVFVLFSSNIMEGQTLQDVYNDYKKKAETDYDDFRKKANKDYADWMRKAWEWHKKIEPIPSPKDDMLPPVIYHKDDSKPAPKPIPYEEIAPAPTPVPQPKPVAPIREKEGEYKRLLFDFYGTNGEVRLPIDFSFKIKGCDANAYAAAWEELSSVKYDNLIRDCLIIRMEHQLCDWAYLMMLGRMSEEACGKGTSEAVMLQGFVFCQSGYKIRFGLTRNNELRLLFKSDHRVFDLEGFDMEDGMFYSLLPINCDGLQICDISYPDEKPLSLWISNEQIFAQQDSKQRILTPEGSKAKVVINTNLNWINFCNTYPTSMIGENILSRWAMYANTPLAKKVKEQLYPQLLSIINKFDNSVLAAGWLLYWVQTAFVYGYDDEVWGRDRAFFAEETLYYPYCDCEDRSILYSRLVRDLLDLDVILVFYPGHLATAVEFKTSINGDYINLNGRRFVICDPTYVGAPIGATMPDMDNKTAKVILLSK